MNEKTPILIDGAEGYGQVLRTAIGLSTLTSKPIKIINIRKGRSRPGLFPQHLTGVKTAAEFCNADTLGAVYGSMELVYSPKKLLVKDKTIDIGTSGSIPLLIQTLTPLLIYGSQRKKIEIIGGTAGLGSPTMGYVKHVTFPILNKLGLYIPEITIERQGFYPKGGGRVSILFEPIRKLHRTILTEQGELKIIRGISVVGSLLESIAERQPQAAKRFLNEKGFKKVLIETEVTNTFSQGTSLTLWAETENTVLGSDVIGARGIRAEDVGRKAAEELVKSIKSGAVLDKYMSDQIIPFLALAEGESTVKVEEMTQHVLTNIEVSEKLLDVKFEIQNNLIKIRGKGFSLT